MKKSRPLEGKRIGCSGWREQHGHGCRWLSSRSGLGRQEEAVWEGAVGRTENEQLQLMQGPVD